MNDRVPVHEPELTEKDAEAVAQAVQSGWVSGVSPGVGEFERKFAAYCGAPFSVAVSSGTAALELALRALGVGPGDEVICPSLTIISCARAIVAVGARPVFVDVDPDTFCLDVDMALARCGPRTQAILAVHLFGHPVDLDRLSEVRGSGVHIVEDAAQAIGSEVREGKRWRRCGSVGDVAAFSFYANKLITTGEGGMVLGRDAAVVARARKAANLFFGDEQRFVHEALGNNYRMSGVQAALGLSQLAGIEDRIARRRAVDATYREALADVSGLRFQTIRPWARPVPWMTAIITEGLTAAMLAERLEKQGIETRPFFVGMHRQPALTQMGIEHDPNDFPVTEALSRHGLYLPSSPSLDISTIHRICEAVRSAMRGSIASSDPSSSLPPSAPATPPAASSASAPSTSSTAPMSPTPSPPLSSSTATSACTSEMSSRFSMPDVESENGGGADDSTVFGSSYAGMYDLLYDSKPYEEEARWVLQTFRRYGGSISRILDVGCGTGRHARALAEWGLDVTGIDQSADMLESARARCRGLTNVRFVHTPLEDLALGSQPFDAATLLFAVLGYLGDDERLVRSLEVLRRHLCTGALLIADYWNAPAVAANPPAERIAEVSTPEGIRIRRAVPSHHPERRIVEVAYALEGTGGQEPVVERHTMRYFDEEELRRLLVAGGFIPLRFGGWPDVESAPSLSQYATAVVARAV